LGIEINVTFRGKKWAGNLFEEIKTNDFVMSINLDVFNELNLHIHPQTNNGCSPNRGNKMLNGRTVYRKKT
jgi:hypothetical protein